MNGRTPLLSVFSPFSSGKRHDFVDIRLSDMRRLLTFAVEIQKKNVFSMNEYNN